MSKRRTKQNASANLDPAAAAHAKLLERQRQNARRNLLKRRRDKSGQQS